MENSNKKWRVFGKVRGPYGAHLKYVVVPADNADAALRTAQLIHGMSNFVKCIPEPDDNPNNKKVNQ